VKTFPGFLSVLSLGAITSILIANGALQPLIADWWPASEAPASQLTASTGEAAGPSGAIKAPSQTSPAGFAVDYASLFLGLLIGVVIAQLAAVPWGDLPRRTVGWVNANQENFSYLALTLGLVAYLVYA